MLMDDEVDWEIVLIVVGAWLGFMPLVLIVYPHLQGNF